MKFGIGVPTSHQGVYLPSPFAGPKEIAHVTTLAERLGFYSAWGLDFMTPTESRLKAPDSLPVWHEILISLAYLAAGTKSIKLGTCTIILPHRDPVLLAKQLATLDVFSGGRVLLGVGVGGSRDEFEAIKPRERKAHRGKMFLESLEALHLLFTQDEASFKGEYYEFHGLSLNPKPLQRPFPVYVSGRTPDTPRRVAKYGTGWLLSRMQNSTVRERIEELPRYLQEVGRDISEIDIVVTRGISIAKTHEEAMERFHRSMLPERMDLTAARAGIGGRPSVERALAQNLIGTSDEIGEQIERIKADGVNHCIILYFAVNAFEEMVDQLQWFGQEVLPKVR